jgi:hypothetical protein
MYRLEWRELTLVHLLHMLRHELVVPLVCYVDTAMLFERLHDDERAWVEAKLAELGFGFGYRVLLDLLARLSGEPSRSGAPRERLATPGFAELCALKHRSRHWQLARKLALTPSHAPGLLRTYLKTELDLRRERRS